MEDVRAVLRHREFRLLWMASSASTLGDRIVFIALALYVTDIGSPTDVGLVLTGLIPQTVPEDELQQANAATSVVQNAGELVGPAIATVLVLGLGAGWAFAFDALTFVISALLLSRVRPRARGERAARQPLLAELRIGWYELRSRQWAWVVIAATSVALLLALAPFLTLGPTIADDLYGSTGVYGALTVAMGAGTVIGSLVGLRWRPRYPIRFAMSWGTIWPPAFALFALGPPLWVTTPLFVLVGFGFAMFDVSWDTSLQERIPPYALSRVSSFDWMGSLALLPVGYLLAGPLAEAFGAVEVLVAGGTLAFIVQVVALITPGVWKLERLQPNSPRPASVVDASA
jgi:hypothetical protein